MHAKVVSFRRWSNLRRTFRPITCSLQKRKTNSIWIIVKHFIMSLWLARVIAQALPVFDIKLAFTIFSIYKGWESCICGKKREEERYGIASYPDEEACFQ